MNWTHAIFALGMNINPRSLRSSRRSEPEERSNHEGDVNDSNVLSIENVTKLKQKNKTPGEKAQLIPFRNGK